MLISDQLSIGYLLLSSPSFPRTPLSHAYSLAPRSLSLSCFPLLLPCFFVIGSSTQHTCLALLLTLFSPTTFFPRAPPKSSPWLPCPALPCSGFPRPTMEVVFGKAAVQGHLRHFTPMSPSIEHDVAITLERCQLKQAGAAAVCALRNFVMEGCRCIFVSGFSSAEDALAVVMHDLPKMLKPYGTVLSELSDGEGTASARGDPNLVAYAACNGQQVSRISEKTPLAAAARPIVQLSTLVSV